MVVTQTSLTAIVNQVKTDISTTYTHIATGDDNTAPDVSDTALGNETFRDAFLQSGTTLTTFFAEIFLDTTENNGNNIEETGMFDAGAAGNMFNRSLTNVITKSANVEAFVKHIINIQAINN